MENDVAPPEQPPQEQNERPKSNKKPLFIGIAVVVVLIVGGLVTFLLLNNDSQKETVFDERSQEKVETRDPELAQETIAEGYTKIWDVQFIDDDNIVFTERAGEMHGMNLTTKDSWTYGQQPGVWAEGEGGLMGVAIDTDFASNRYLYICYNSETPTRTVKVERLKLGEGPEGLKNIEQRTVIIDDIQSKAGRHSGCRMEMDQNAHLWIGTGDSAIGSAPQDPQSLAGKVLRVDREGNGVSENPGGEFDPRIHSYGHRNIQGIALFENGEQNGAFGIMAEHGTNEDDEVNLIKQANFGYDPEGSTGSYLEREPMTNLAKFPDAEEAIWASGDSTIAASGVEILSNDAWLGWKDYVAIAALKSKHIRIVGFDDNYNTIVFEREIVKDQYGRIRAVTQAPNGDLYFTTDNGGDNDKIVKIIPR